jgi:hypothetical protein
MGKASRRKRERREKEKEFWTPLQPARLVGADAGDAGFERVFKNNLYTVLVRRMEPRSGFPPMVHLSFRRNDRKTCVDWRHKQYIKNEICGEECEAVEVFPAESRLVDTSNQYHLWVFEDGYQLPFGFGERLVCNSEESSIGAVQRPFEEGKEPEDAKSASDVDEEIKKHKEGDQGSVNNGAV